MNKVCAAEVEVEARPKERKSVFLFFQRGTIDFIPVFHFTTLAYFYLPTSACSWHDR